MYISLSPLPLCDPASRWFRKQCHVKHHFRALPCGFGELFGVSYQFVGGGLSLSVFYLQWSWVM